MRQKTACLFVLYSLLLVWGIVFKLDVWSTLQQAQYGGTRAINLIPFSGTAIYNGYLDIVEIGLNILAFIPLGIFLELLRKEAEWWNQLLMIGAVSLGFETIQYSFRLGVADITDVLSNSLGGAIGIVGMYMITSVWREETEKRLQLPLLLGILMIVLYAFVTGF